MPYCPGDPDEGLCYDMDEGEQNCDEEHPRNKCVECTKLFCEYHFDSVKKMCPQCKKRAERKRARIQPFRVLILGRVIEQEELEYGWSSVRIFREQFFVDADQPIEVTLLDRNNPEHAKIQELPDRINVISVRGSFPFNCQLEHKYDIIMNDWSTLKFLWIFGYTPAAFRWLIAPGGHLFLRDVNNKYEGRRVLLNTTKDRIAEAQKRCSLEAKHGYGDPVKVQHNYPDPPRLWYVNLTNDETKTTVEDFVLAAFVVPLYERLNMEIPSRSNNSAYELVVNGKPVSTQDLLDKPLGLIGIVKMSVVSMRSRLDCNHYFNDIDIALKHEGFLSGEYYNAADCPYPLHHLMEPCEEYGVWRADDTIHEESALWERMYHQREHEAGIDCPDGTPTPDMFKLLCM